jgi:hypothetical protein
MLIITETGHLFIMEQCASGIWVSYLDEEKRTNQPTKTTRTLPGLRCCHRSALSDVFRFWAAQRCTFGAEVLRHPSHRTRFTVSTSCSARLSGLKVLMFGRLLTIGSTHNRSATLFGPSTTILAVCKRVLRTLFVYESFPVAVFQPASGPSVRGFLGIRNRIHCIRIR